MATDGQELRDGKNYGCHVDLNPGEQPDGCVLDYDAPSDCVYAIHGNGRVRKSKWTCEHWKPVEEQEDAANEKV